LTFAGKSPGLAIFDNCFWLLYENCTQPFLDKIFCLMKYFLQNILLPFSDFKENRLRECSARHRARLAGEKCKEVP